MKIKEQLRKYWLVFIPENLEKKLKLLGRGIKKIISMVIVLETYYPWICNVIMAKVVLITPKGCHLITALIFLNFMLLNTKYIIFCNSLIFNKLGSRSWFMFLQNSWQIQMQEVRS